MLNFLPKNFYAKLKFPVFISGPCAYCNMWRTIRYMSYCGRYPFCSVNCTKKFAVYKREQGELLEKVHEDDKPAKKLKVHCLHCCYQYRS